MNTYFKITDEWGEGFFGDKFFPNVDSAVDYIKERYDDSTLCIITVTDRRENAILSQDEDNIEVRPWDDNDAEDSVSQEVESYAVVTDGEVSLHDPIVAESEGILTLSDGTEMHVFATTNHPTSSYGQPVWVDVTGQAITQVGLEKMAGCSVQILRSY